ncbi:hypothetical protein BU26DRAFT_504681 [Trematosphaeria pertusa]|uniref:Uncharacterized protein n=1 Tax=Trematosphaeria pertusa TaxID=390896 RepID=A0A6A6IJI7_9PLEO|nr:uncharacterized protein BU26DRAFT_504681 [Trematosphaeria pertusa]KAF2250337.1 hypothetical protein BU26DRAFT_504681 [Trematosphaeria pertusa]
MPSETFFSTLDARGNPAADFRSTALPKHYHRSRTNKSRAHHKQPPGKYHRQQTTKRTIRSDLFREEWISDLDWFRYEDWCFDHNLHLDWDDMHWHPDESEAEDEGHASEGEERRIVVAGRTGASRAGEEREVQWNWHRLLEGGPWYATAWGCKSGWCSCAKFRGEDVEERREWWDGGWEGCGDEVVESEEEDDTNSERLVEDWDVVSLASSAWTESESVEPELDVSLAG